MSALELFYREDGNPGGPPALLVHAFPTSHALWERQIEALGERYRLIRPDLRGFGQSPVPPPPYAMEELAADVVRLLDRLEIERINYVGISMGGMIGQLLALSHPERLQSLALCMTTSVVPAETPEGDDPAYSICARLMRAAAERSRRDGLGPIVEMCIERWFTPDFRSSDWARRVGRIVAANSVDGYCGGVEALCGFNATERLGDIRMPTLVMPGAIDPSAPPRCSEEIAARIPDARLKVIDGASHIGIVERPDACNACLLDHLNRFA